MNKKKEHNEFFRLLQEFGMIPLASLRPPIRSFVRREGRMSKSRVERLELLWPLYGIDQKGLLNWEAIFGRQGEIVLEIGFGDGRSLIEMAKKAPEKNFVGVEVYRTGVSQLLGSLEKYGISNVRILCGDAVEVLTNQIPHDSLTKLQIFFPDPWPKIRHHKRRLIQSAFVGLVSKKLKEGGVLHLATDWMDYAYHMISVLSSVEGIQNIEKQGQFAPRPDFRPLTKYEKRGLKLGHQTWDLLFKRARLS